ncbi:MAG: hypothetical protein WBB45_15350 [Cyclobacteriaceae bacterium]
MTNEDHPEYTPKMKRLRIFSWIFMGLALVTFYLSLRSPSDNVEYTVAALAIWSIAFLFHYLLQQEKKKQE